MPKVRRITPSEIDQIQRLYATGLGYKGVGLAVGRHWTTVRDLIPHAMRHKPPGKKSHVDRDIAVRRYNIDGWPLWRIAAMFGCKMPTLKKVLGPNFEYRDGNKPSPSLIRERAALRAEDRPEKAAAPKTSPAPAEGKPSAIDFGNPRVPSVLHLVDFKRAGHSAEWYRANCEIPAELDAAELRALRRHPRLVVHGHQHGSWMGSPAALCVGHVA
jgi:hypothetical protein